MISHLYVKLWNHGPKAWYHIWWISYMISCKLWYHMMISCTWNMKLQVSWYPWYLPKTHDIIYDIIANYDIIIWYHRCSRFLGTLISPKNPWYRIGCRRKLWYIKFLQMISVFDVRAWYHSPKASSDDITRPNLPQSVAVGQPMPLQHLSHLPPRQ